MLGFKGREQKLLWYHLFMDPDIERNDIDLTRVRTFTSVSEMTEIINNDISFYFSLDRDDDLAGANLIGDENVSHLCSKNAVSQAYIDDLDDKAESNQDTLSDLFIDYKSPPIRCGYAKKLGEKEEGAKNPKWPVVVAFEYDHDSIKEGAFDEIISKYSRSVVTEKFGYLDFVIREQDIFCDRDKETDCVGHIFEYEKIK